MMISALKLFHTVASICSISLNCTYIIFLYKTKALIISHSTIKFIVKLEADGMLPFLDILLIRKGDSSGAPWVTRATGN